MPFSFDSPPLLWLAVGLTAIAGFFAVIRRVLLPRWTWGLMFCGLVLFSLAAGGMNWRRARLGEVLVMLDVSPSTRTATYRDRAVLDRRLQQLLGDTPRKVLLFAQESSADHGQAVFSDIPCDHTVYAPPPAEAILLFSDGRFDLPTAAPRTYVVIDPALEQPEDAVVQSLQIRGKELVSQVAVAGRPRVLSLHGTAATQPVQINAGNLAIHQALRSASASAQFSTGDAWPENDALSIEAPPAQTSERWWVGNSAPQGWRLFDAAALPLAGAAYLAPSVIVLNNVPAKSLAAAQSPLQQYVRDLGGSLVILGGDRAFAAGDYGSSLLEQLSPLASHPPQPSMQWIILVDGSGSMGEATSGGSRWQMATAAVGQLLPHLPPDDLATLGSFAENISWWSSGKSVRETINLPIPPSDLSPRGPTNLQRALADITRSVAGASPKQLILITDADARVEDAQSIAAEMKSKRMTLSVFAIGQGSGLEAIKQIAAATGGAVSSVNAAESWSAGLLELSRGAMPTGVENSPLLIRYLPPLPLNSRTVDVWNRVWLKSNASALAAARIGGESLTPLARWRVGNGEVVAAGFATSINEAVGIADLIARPPRDPRFRVAWDFGRDVRVSIDALDGKKWLNEQKLSLELRDAQGVTAMTSHAIPQTAPGMYELRIPAPRRPTFGTVRWEGGELDQIAIAGRYAPEFDAIGNDHELMHALAEQTGGQVIDVRQEKAIDFHWPRRDVALGPWLAGGGALLVMLGLVRWRMG